MRKLVVLTLMLAGIATLATAQTKSRYYAESAKDNYFMGIGVGAQALVNPDNGDYGYGSAITPLFNLIIYLTVTLYVMLKIAGEFSFLVKSLVNLMDKKIQLSI